MQTQNVVTEVLGATLSKNGDGSYTITYPDQSTETFGRILAFTEHQATMSFYECVDSFLSRGDREIEREFFGNFVRNDW